MRKYLISFFLLLASSVGAQVTVTVAAQYDSTATVINYNIGPGPTLPGTPFLMHWWNSTDYATYDLDPHSEDVNVTNVSTSGVPRFTVTRGYNGTTAQSHSLGGKTYSMISGVVNTPTNTFTPTITNTPTNTPTASGPTTVYCSNCGGGGGGGGVYPTNTFAVVANVTVVFVLPTLTPTYTNTPTGSPTPTNTPTGSFTFTPIYTLSFTPTPSFTLTPSYSPTNSPVFSNTFTPTISFTATNTLVFTNSFTFTPSFTPTNSFTAVPATNSFTWTPSDTRTPSFTPTNTFVFTNSFTFTPSFTPTNSLVFSNTFTPTPSFTPTNTLVFTNSFTPTISFTPTNSPIFTNSFTPTISYTPTLSFTFTPSYTASANPSPTFTPRGTLTPTNSPTFTMTFNATTGDWTLTPTPTPNAPGFGVQDSVTGKYNYDQEPVVSLTPQAGQEAVGDNRLASDFEVANHMNALAQTYTPTATAIATETSSPTATFTATFTWTAPAVVIINPTSTNTPIATETNSMTPTNTFTPTAVNDNAGQSYSETLNMRPTANWTVVVTPPPFVPSAVFFQAVTTSGFGLSSLVVSLDAFQTFGTFTNSGVTLAPVTVTSNVCGLGNVSTNSELAYLIGSLNRPSGYTVVLQIPTCLVTATPSITPSPGPVAVILDFRR